MSGLSKRNVKLDNIENTLCYRMIENVTTENNVGFIQIKILTKPIINIKEHEGIFVYVYGNNNNYSMRISTEITVVPWQYYSFNFFVPNK